MDVDFLGTPFGKWVAQRLSYARIGNAGATSLEKLSYSTDTQTLSGRLKVRVKHSWGTVSWTDYFSIPPVDNEEEISVDATGYGEFAYNLLTGQYTAGLRIPLGERSVSFLGETYRYNFGEVTIGSGELYEALNGNLAAMTSSFPTSELYRREFENDYALRQQQLISKYGAGNIYLASKDFVDLLCASRAAEYAMSLILTSGASSSAIMQSVTGLAASEAGAIAAWLGTKAVNEAQKVAKAIVTGKGVRIPNYYLAVKWAPIEYRSRVFVFGEVPATPWIKEAHGAFYIVVEKREPGNTPSNTTSGYDPGPLSRQPDFPGQSGGLPHDTGDQTGGFVFPVGIDASSSASQFPVSVKNDTAGSIFVAIIRGAQPAGWWRDEVPPGHVHHTSAQGVSERVVGAWDMTSGRLLCAMPLVISAPVNIVVKFDYVMKRHYFATYA